MKILGMISGTSVDGIDVALVEVSGLPNLSDSKNSTDFQVTSIAAHTYLYERELRQEILEVCDGKPRSLLQIFELDRAIAKAFSQAALALMEFSQVKPDLIASHGQTVFHQPPQAGELGYSLQLGRGEAIAKYTGITTVSNFRGADIAAGGEGAPLVPMLDWLLFTDKQEVRCIQNIGGISNVTYLGAGCLKEQAIGFDNAPGNVSIDLAAQQLFDRAFDPNGSLAAQGIADLDLVQTWLKQEFFHLAPPKSTGRELFGLSYLEERLKESSHLSSYDILATLTEFTAQAIAQSYRDFLPQFPNRVLICGGGSRNSYLMQCLGRNLQPAIVEPLDNLGINADFKEAIAFAVLGYLRYHKLPGNLPSVTGAKESVLLGEIYGSTQTIFY
jgi:anhydro-N-acetylmuramic acid kinase